MEHQVCKVLNGINYSIYLNDKKVCCGEYEENPHGLNNEVCCNLNEFVDKSSRNAVLCHSMINEYFGKQKLDELLQTAIIQLSQ